MNTVNVSELKAHLSEYLRAVRGGTSVTVTDRRTPVARIVPYEQADRLPTRRPTRSLRDVEMPGPISLPAGALEEALAAER